MQVLSESTGSQAVCFPADSERNANHDHITNVCMISDESLLPNFKNAPLNNKHLEFLVLGRI